MATGKRERDEVVERELEQAVRTMHDAHRRNDLAYLDAAMADDFTIIHANGDLLTKEEWFADLRSERPAGSVSRCTTSRAASSVT